MAADTAEVACRYASDTESREGQGAFLLHLARCHRATLPTDYGKDGIKGSNRLAQQSRIPSPQNPAQNRGFVLAKRSIGNLRPETLRPQGVQLAGRRKLRAGIAFGWHALFRFQECHA